MALNDNAMVNLATAKAWLKIPTATTTDDALVELIINSASQDIETTINRKIKSQPFTEIRHGKAGNILMLREWPIVSVTEVRFDLESKFTDVGTLVDTDDYTLGDNNQSLVFHARQIPRGYNNVQVSYIAGYDPVPADLQMACLWLISWIYNIRRSDDIGRSSKGKGDESVSWSQAAPDYVTTTLNKYKRTEFPAGDAIERNQ